MTIPKPGDRLLVIQSSMSRYGAEKQPVEAEVTKVGRVWVELTEINQVRSMARTWRMRMDTQRTDNGTNYNDRFVTAEQYAYEQRMKAVNDCLKDAGIRIEWSAAVAKDDELLIALANTVRRHQGLDEV